MIKPIVHWPDPRLSQKSEEITVFDDNIKALFLDMKETLIHEKGVGLSAIQIGVPLRACTIVWLSDFSHKPEFLEMCNPVILDKNGTEYSKEGCLSVKDLFIPIHAPEDITVAFKDPTGVDRRYSLDGLLARCIVHEERHMDGGLILDCVDKYKRNEVIKKYKKQLAKVK